MLDQLFEQFIQEKTYIQNCSTKTIKYFRQSYKAYKSTLGEPSLPSKHDINQFVIGMREKGMSVGCCNAYIKGINSFLDWLFANNLINEKLKIRILKQEKKVLRSFSDDELRRILSFHPKTFAEFRLHALLLTLIDTGCRIDELLSLTRQGINFDSLFVIVKGKGSKERIIPISFELRKTLYRFLKRHTFDLVFPSRNGTKLNYQNVYRDFEILCKRIRIEPAGFHTLRRTYAKNYLRNGGNLFYLQSTMGHSRLETTRGYVEVEIEALKETHLKTSVDFLLDGGIQRSSDRIRVTIQLVSVRDRNSLWADKFDENLTGIFEIQDSISERVVAALALKLSGEERALLTKRYTENIEAYQAYLKGQYFWNRYTVEGFEKGIEYFEQAIRIDEDYAPAYAGLADAYYSNLYLSPKEAMPKAKDAAIKALELDDTLAEAHASLGLVKAFYEWDWLNAEREFKQAIDLNPGRAVPHKEYGWYLLPMGRFEESLAELKQAQRIDPLHLLINLDMGLPFYFGRRYDQAVEQFQKIIEMESNFWPARFFLGQAYAQMGQFQQALAEYKKARLIDNGPWVLAGLGHAYAALGNEDEACAMIRQLEAFSKQYYVSPYCPALVYAGLKDKDQAFEWLEKAYEQRDQWLAWLRVDPMLDSLRSDVRFIDLMRRVNLAP